MSGVGESCAEVSGVGVSGPGTSGVPAALVASGFSVLFPGSAAACTCTSVSSFGSSANKNNNTATSRKQ